MSGLWTTEDSMTRRRGESRIPAFRTGDRVLIVDDDAQAILGDDTGTVEEVAAPFHEREYRVVAADPEEAESTIYPDEGTLLATEQIAPISANAPEDRP
jgi:hypothetical protein